MLIAIGIGAAVYGVRSWPVAVERHLVREGEVVDEVLGTGTLESRTKAAISSKIAGRIAELLVDQGDRVRSGELLVRLDDAELRQQVEIARANHAAAQAAIARAQADRDRTTAVADQARRQHARVMQLFTRNSASAEEVDRVNEALAVATAGLAESEAALAQARTQLVAEEKTLEYHRARLDDTAITAPFEGLIVRRDRDPGDVVVPGSSILALVSTDTLWISAWVDETRMARIAEDLPARVVFRSDPERSFPGTVVRLGREADRETREYIVDVAVQELPTNWAIGQRAEVYIATARKTGVPLLPTDYVSWQGANPGAFVAVGGSARWRPIRLGLSGAGSVEILDGLRPGDLAIVPADARASLAEGRRVELP